MRHYNFGFWYGRIKYFRTRKSQILLKRISPVRISSDQWRAPAHLYHWFKPYYQLRDWVNWQRFRLWLRLESLADYLGGLDTRFYTRRNKWVKVLLGGEWPKKHSK